MAGVSVSCTSVGRSSQRSSQVATCLPPCLMSCVRLLGIPVGERYPSGKDLTILLQRTARGMRGREYSAASTRSTPTVIPLIIRFRIGKFCGRANFPRGNSPDHSSAESEDLF